MSVEYALEIFWKSFVDVGLHVMSSYFKVNEAFHALVTEIPLEPTRQGSPQNDSRPAWIRPVRKKTLSSATRSSQSGDSPSQLDNSSPEAFSPSDFFMDPPKPATFQAGPQALPLNGVVPISTTTNSFGNNGPDQQQQQRSPSSQSFLDPSAMDLSSQLYLSHVDMMNMFGDNGVGGVDVAQMFTPEFIRAQQISTPTPGQNGIDIGQANGGSLHSGFSKLSVPSP